MKLTKEKRSQLILVGIVAVGLSAAIWQMLIQASFQEMVKQKSLGEKAEKRLKEAETFLASDEALQREASVLSNALLRLEAEMTSSTDPYTWCVQLMRKVAEDHEDVVIREITAPQSPAALDVIAEFPYKAITFGVRGRAHWEDLGRFLADFENRYPLFSTRQLQVGPQGDKESTGDTAAETAEPASREILSFSMNVVALVKPGS